MMEITVTALIITKFGIDLSVFITSNFDEIVPIHNRSYLVFDAVGLLHLLIRCYDDSFVLDFLAGAFGTVIEQ